MVAGAQFATKASSTAKIEKGFATTEAMLAKTAENAADAISDLIDSVSNDGILLLSIRALADEVAMLKKQTCLRAITLNEFNMRSMRKEIFQNRSKV